MDNLSRGKIKEWIELIYSQSCNGVVILNKNGEILGYSEGVINIWECPGELLLKKDKAISLSEVIKLDKPFTNYIEELKNLGHIQINKLRFSTYKDNTKLANLSGWVLKKDEDECITGWLWCDATTFYKEAESSYFDSLQGLLNSVFQKAPVLFFLWKINPDYTTEILGINELSEKELQLSANDVLGRDFVEFAIPTPWRKPIMKYIKQMFNKPEPYLGNYPIFNSKGEEIYVRWVDVPVKPSENVVWVISIGENIHERSKLERKVRESEQRYKRMLEAVTDYVFHVTIHNGEVVETIHSPGCESVTGYTPEDFNRDPYLWLNMVVEEDRGKVIEYANALMRGEPRSPITHRIYRKDGQIRWIKNTSVLIFDENNNVIGYDGIIRDVTAEILAYEKLQKSEELYRNIVEQLIEGYLRIDLSGRITFANSSANKMLGLESLPESTNLFELIADKDREKFVSAITRIINRETESEVVECQLLDKPTARGEVVECSILPVESISKHITGFSVLMRNVTQRKRDIERMLDIQRKESLANLVGGLAHDFNNLLMVMQGHIDLMFAEYYPDSIPEPIVEHINEIQSAISKAGHLCKQMMLYSGKGVFIVKKRLELNKFLKEITPLLETVVTRKINLNFQYFDAPLWIDGDELLLRQAILGIVTNSVEAIGTKRGKITIRTAEQFYTNEMLSNFLSEGSNLNPGKYVELEIEDNGCGISPGNLKRIFEPFFTTKFLGRGLGLSAIYGIVRKHRGAIRIESEENKGTKVVIILPSAEEEEKGSEKVGDALPQEKNVEEESILLVEDEKYLGSIINKVLNSRGYHVIYMNDFDSALSLLKSENGSKIKLLILDIGLPEHDVERMLAQIVENKIEVPVILCCGSQIEKIPEKYDKIIHAKVKKPFVISEIVDLVDQFWKARE